MIPAPFKHQEITSNFIQTHPHTIITSSPGTGKTRSVIDALDDTHRLLVVCPKSIMEASWGNDIKTFAPRFSYALSVAGKKRPLPFLDESTRIVILNHDGITWLEKNHRLLQQHNWMVCIDEFTAFKNPQANRTKALLKLSGYFERRIIMSGTPTPNSAMDLFAPMRFLDNGLRLGTNFYRLRSQICYPTQQGPHIKWIDRPGAFTTVASLIADINIRHRLEDVIDMPEHINRTIHTRLDNHSARTYSELRDESVVLLERGEVTAVNAAVAVQKLLQICAGTVYDEDGNALDVSGERYDLVAELVAEREHSIVAFAWKHQLPRLIEKVEARGISWCAIRSEDSADKRAEIVNRYQAGEFQVLFAHPKTASHGLTLTRASTVIWASPSWSSESYIQFNQRHYRAGQSKRTEVINIAAADTWEGEVYKRLSSKIGNQSTLLEVLTNEPTGDDPPQTGSDATEISTGITSQ